MWSSRQRLEHRPHNPQTSDVTKREEVFSTSCGRLAMSFIFSCDAAVQRLRATECTSNALQYACLGGPLRRSAGERKNMGVTRAPRLVRPARGFLYILLTSPRGDLADGQRLLFSEVGSAPKGRGGMPWQGRRRALRARPLSPPSPLGERLTARAEQPGRVLCSTFSGAHLGR